MAEVNSIERFERYEAYRCRNDWTCNTRALRATLCSGLSIPAFVLGVRAVKQNESSGFAIPIRQIFNIVFVRRISSQFAGTVRAALSRRTELNITRRSQQALDTVLLFATRRCSARRLVLDFTHTAPRRRGSRYGRRQVVDLSPTSVAAICVMSATLTELVIGERVHILDCLGE